eukprot:497384-Hanusia_phi.AAC.1
MQANRRDGGEASGRKAREVRDLGRAMLRRDGTGGEMRRSGGKVEAAGVIYSYEEGGGETVVLRGHRGAFTTLLAHLWRPYAQGARKLEILKPIPQQVPSWFAHDNVKGDTTKRWDANMHRLRHGFRQAVPLKLTAELGRTDMLRQAERRKAIDLGTMLRPSLVKLSSSLSRGAPSKDDLHWQPPRCTPAAPTSYRDAQIPEAVRNPEVKNIYKLQNIQGIRQTAPSFLETIF